MIKIEMKDAEFDNFIDDFAGQRLNIARGKQTVGNAVF